MNKSYYTDYARHCLRFYTRYKNPKFKRKSDENNWNAADKVYQKLSDEDKNTVDFVYGQKDTIADNVFALANERGCEQNAIWNAIAQIEEKVGYERGLLG